MFLSLYIEQLRLCLEISACWTFSQFGNILNIWSSMRRNLVQQIWSAILPVAGQCRYSQSFKCIYNYVLYNQKFTLTNWFVHTALNESFHRDRNIAPMSVQVPLQPVRTQLVVPFNSENKAFMDTLAVRLSVMSGSTLLCDSNCFSICFL